MISNIFKRNDSIIIISSRYIKLYDISLQPCFIITIKRIIQLLNNYLNNFFYVNLFFIFFQLLLEFLFKISQTL